MRVVYCPEQIRKSIEFINKHNTHVDITQDEVAEMIRRGIRDNLSMTGTAGYYLTFSWEGDNIVYVEMLVDVTVSQDCKYITAEMKV